MQHAEAELRFDPEHAKFREPTVYFKCPKCGAQNATPVVLERHCRCPHCQPRHLLRIVAAPVMG